MEYVYKPCTKEELLKLLEEISNKPYKPTYISYIGKYIVEADNYEDYMKGCLEVIEILEKENYNKA